MRAFPSSKRHPQFSRQPLAASLESFGIAYDWQGGALGGFRKGGYAEHICIMCAAEGRMREHALHPQEDLWRDV